LRLSSILGGTRLLCRLKARYQNEPVVIAGTSAGAMQAFRKAGPLQPPAQAVAVQPGMLGIWLVEDTSLIVYPGNRIEVIGRGS
jgi:cyanophycinase